MVLTSPDSAVRGHAVRSLGQFGTAAKYMIPRLLPLLLDSSDIVRDATAAALTSIEPQWQTRFPPPSPKTIECIGVLRQALGKTIKEQDSSALEAARNRVPIKELGDFKASLIPEFRAVIRSWEKTGDGYSVLRLVLKELADIGPQADGALLDIWEELERRLEYGVSEFVECLESILPGANDELKRKIRERIDLLELSPHKGDTEDSPACRTLCEKCSRAGYIVRALAIYGAAASDKTKMLTKLLSAIEGNTGFKAEVAHALGCIGPAAKDAASALARVLKERLDNEDEVDLCRECAVALGKIGPAAESTIPTLELAFRASDKSVAQAAYNALKQIQKK